MLSELQSGQQQHVTANGPKKQKDRNGRKNAAIACDVCRRRRVRCLPADSGEANQPCKGCAAGGVDCVFTGQDRRKESMQELRNKLSQFENLFTSLSGAGSGPQQSGSNAAAIDPALAHMSSNGGNNGSFLPPSMPSHSHHHQHAMPPPPLPQQQHRSESLDSNERGSKKRRLSPSHSQEGGLNNGDPSPQNFFASPSGSGSLNLQSGGSPASLVRPNLQGQSGSGGVPVVMDRLTLEAGEIRAYGPTSNQTLAAEGHISHEAPDTEPGDVRMQAPLSYAYQPFENMSLLVSAAKNIDSVPLGTDIRTIEHLLVNYFIWHHVVFPVTSCRLFLDAFVSGGTYCTPLLLNAMLALASHLTDWKLARADPDDPATTGATFFACAKSLLDDELENPSVTTVQALCLMAKYEAYNGRALKGGLYMVMSGRLVLDLGLHLDPTHLVQKGVLSAEAAWMRSRAFWGVWSVDKEFSALVGRPSAVRGILISCPKPSYWQGEDIDWWASYTSGRLIGISNDTSRGIYQISDLAMTMAGVHLKAMDSMYWTESKRSLEDNMAALEASMQVTAEAMAAIPPLPDQGEASNFQPAHLTLHMVWYCHIIIINRPFLFATGFKAPGALSPARQRCFDSARQIVRIMCLIRDATPNGLRTTLNTHQHNLITAASIMILELTPRIAMKDRQAAAREDLAKVFSMLEEMARFRPAARQALENLRDLHRTTETQSTLANMANGQEASSARTQAAWSQPTEASLLEKEDSAADGLFSWDAFGGAGGQLGADFTDFSDFDTFLAQQQAYLYPTLSCSNLFDANGFFQSQLLQSRPSSPREGRSD